MEATPTTPTPPEGAALGRNLPRQELDGEFLVATLDTTRPELLTTAEAAEYLRIPLATLYTWRTRRRGYGPKALRYGSTLRYDRAALDAWLRERQEGALA